jgi:AraC family transcriptional regulator, transcriptional activator FtrA
MAKSQRAVKVAYLLPDQFWSSTVVAGVEIFHGMALHTSAFQSKVYRGFDVSLLRTTHKKPTGFSGLPLDTQHFAEPSIKDEPFDAIIIPGVWNLSMENLRESRTALAWLRQQHQQGCIIAGMVTGVFYLAEAGLLDGREATIHWASVNIFQQRYPKIKITPQLQLIESDNIISTSTTPATFDLTLMLIQRFLGDRAAEYAAHYFAIRDKESPLPEFLEPTSHDTLVDAVRDKIRMNYAEDLTLDNLAAELNVTSRTLSRRFVSATGMSPIHYLNKQRLNIARRLLQSTNLQIQLIAEQSGFASATVFGRNFKQEFGQTPRGYRDSLSNN